MKILALDLGTLTGWAFWDGQRLESGVQDFTKQRGESNGMLFLKFNRWLGEYAEGASKADAWLPELIIFEQAHHRGGAATEIGVGLMTRVLEFAVAHGIQHTPLHSLSLKKWATGSGKSDKVAMMKAAEMTLYGQPAQNGNRKITDDNEADAILLASYAMERFGK